VKFGLVVDRVVRLGDVVILLLVGGEVVDLVIDDTLLDRTIRRFDEAELVDAGVAARELIRPMFGPSGVSIGQIRP
jgi:hypothetical protein